jgi:hypothetical protein
MIILKVLSMLNIHLNQSTRRLTVMTAKSFGDNFTVYLMNDTLKTILETFSSPDMDELKEDRSEMDSILSNET